MKKVLIITYYWPPASGPGVQRWLKFVKYLRDFNIEPVVYIPKNPSYPISDPSLEEEIPRDIEILHKSILEPYGLAKIFSKNTTETLSAGIVKEAKKQNLLQKCMLFIRGNLFIPDARMLWVKPSVKFLKSYLKKHSLNAIITTGPPHSVHLIGLSLKAETNLPWIADFRDPWTTIGYHDKLRLTKYSAKRHKILEKKVLQSADQIITTSPKTKADFEQLTDKPVECITNGFDTVKKLSVTRDENFSISHIGSLLEKRNPEILWQALGEIAIEHPDFRQHLKIKLAGKVSEQVIASIKNNGLGEYLELLGYVSHKRALALQRETQLLLLIEVDSKETQAIIPGKVFEYLAARRPILAIGPKNADFFTIIEETQSGVCFDYKQKEALKSQLLHWFKEYTNQGIAGNNSGISQYSRKHLTGELAQLIHRRLEKAN